MKLEQFKKLYKRCDRKYIFCGPHRTFNYDNYEVEGVCIDSEQIAISAHEIGCFENLKYIVIEDGLEMICSGTFYNSKVEEIKLPNSVKYIDKEALVNEYLRYLELPLHCLEFVNDNILTTTNIKIKDDKIICKAPDDFIVNYFPYDKEINLYIENYNFNFKWFDYFPEIETLHISSDKTKFDYSGLSVPTTGPNLIKPRFVKRIYLNKNNPNFIFKDHCLIDKTLNIVLFIEMKPVIKLNSAFDTCEYLPDMTISRKYGFGEPIRFDISGSKFFKEERGTIRNYRNSCVYIPDEEEILITCGGGFADNVLLEHYRLRKLIICSEGNEKLNIYELSNALQKYSEHTPILPCIGVSIEVVVPTDIYFSPLSTQYFGTNVKITIKDVEEPYSYLE